MKKRRSLIVWAIILVLLIAILLTMFASVMVFNGLYSKLDLSEEKISSIDTDSYNLMDDKDVFNVLLIGTDKDEDEQDTDGASRRSDSIMILSLNRKTNTVKVASIMRDTYVEIPGEEPAKINNAYYVGGPLLLAETIMMNFKIKIHAYMQVNFDAFVKVINQIGGISLTLTESEAEQLNTTNYIKVKKFRNLQPGKQKLNGYQALGYCRIRHGTAVNGVMPGVYTASGKGDDFGRTERQRKVIKAIVRKFKRASMDRKIKAVQNAAPYIKTDIEKKDVIKCAMSVFKADREINQLQIPTDYEDTYVGGQEVLMPDLKKCRKNLKKFMYSTSKEDSKKKE